MPSLCVLGGLQGPWGPSRAHAMTSDLCTEASRVLYAVLTAEGGQAWGRREEAKLRLAPLPSPLLSPLPHSSPLLPAPPLPPPPPLSHSIPTPPPPLPLPPPLSCIVFMVEYALTWREKADPCVGKADAGVLAFLPTPQLVRGP